MISFISGTCKRIKHGRLSKQIMITANNVQFNRVYKWFKDNQCLTWAQASMWCWSMGTPATGNRGLGTSNDRGRNLVPEHSILMKCVFYKVFISAFLSICYVYIKISSDFCYPISDAITCPLRHVIIMWYSCCNIHLSFITFAQFKE